MAAAEEPVRAATVLYPTSLATEVQEAAAVDDVSFEELLRAQAEVSSSSSSIRLSGGRPSGALASAGAAVASLEEVELRAIATSLGCSATDIVRCVDASDLTALISRAQARTPDGRPMRSPSDISHSSHSRETTPGSCPLSRAQLAACGLTAAEFKELPEDMKGAVFAAAGLSPSAHQEGSTTASTVHSPSDSLASMRSSGTGSRRSARPPPRSATSSSLPSARHGARSSQGVNSPTTLPPINASRRSQTTSPRHQSQRSPSASSVGSEPRSRVASRGSRTSSRPGASARAASQGVPSPPLPPGPPSDGLPGARPSARRVAGAPRNAGPPPPTGRAPGQLSGLSGRSIGTSVPADLPEPTSRTSPAVRAVPRSGSGSGARRSFEARPPLPDPRRR